MNTNIKKTIMLALGACLLFPHSAYATTPVDPKIPLKAVETHADDMENPQFKRVFLDVSDDLNLIVSNAGVQEKIALKGLVLNPEINKEKAKENIKQLLNKISTVYVKNGLVYFGENKTLLNRELLYNGTMQLDPNALKETDVISEIIGKGHIFIEAVDKEGKHLAWLKEKELDNTKVQYSISKSDVLSIGSERYLVSGPVEPDKYKIEKDGWVLELSKTDPSIVTQVKYVKEETPDPSDKDTATLKIRYLDEKGIIIQRENVSLKKDETKNISKEEVIKIDGIAYKIKDITFVNAVVEKKDENYLLSVDPNHSEGTVDILLEKEKNSFAGKLTLYFFSEDGKEIGKLVKDSPNGDKIIIPRSEIFTIGNKEYEIVSISSHETENVVQLKDSVEVRFTEKEKEQELKLVVKEKEQKIKGVLSILFIDKNGKEIGRTEKEGQAFEIDITKPFIIANKHYGVLKVEESIQNNRYPIGKSGIVKQTENAIRVQFNKDTKQMLLVFTLEEKDPAAIVVDNEKQNIDDRKGEKPEITIADNYKNGQIVMLKKGDQIPWNNIFVIADKDKAHFQITGGRAVNADLSTVGLKENVTLEVHWKNVKTGEEGVVTAPGFKIQVYEVNQQGQMVGTSVPMTTSGQVQHQKTPQTGDETSIGKLLGYSAGLFVIALGIFAVWYVKYRKEKSADEINAQKNK